MSEAEWLVSKLSVGKWLSARLLSRGPLMGHFGVKETGKWLMK